MGQALVSEGVFPEPRNDAAVFGAPAAEQRPLDVAALRAVTINKTSSPYPIRNVLARTYDPSDSPVRDAVDSMLGKFAEEDRRMRAEVLPTPPESYEWEAKIDWTDNVDLSALTAEVTAKLIYRLRPLP